MLPGTHEFRLSSGRIVFVDAADAHELRAKLNKRINNTKDPRDAERVTQEVVWEIVREHGWMIVLRALTNAMSISAVRHGDRGDTVAANNTLKFKKLLDDVYKAAHR